MVDENKPQTAYCAMQVGASAEAVRASHEAIVSILNARVDNKTMRAALAALASTCSVNGMNVSNCSFTMGGPND